MNTVPGDFLMTYDPEYFEEHVDSSDFEDPQTPWVLPKSGNHCLIAQEVNRIVTKKEKEILNNKISRRNRIKNEEHKTQVRKINEHIFGSKHEQATKTKIKKAINIGTSQNQCSEELHQNHGDRNIEIRSKKSLIRHTIIPCLSSMFGRSSNKLSATKENLAINVSKDNSCQPQCTNSEGPHKRKYSRERNYIVHPVYALEGIHELPFKTTKTTQATLRHRKPNRKSPTKQLFNTSCTASLSSDNDSEELEKEKHNKFKKCIKSELKKEFAKYQRGKYKKHQEQQYPSKLGPYQVFATPYQDQSRLSNMSPGSGNTCRANAPSSSSSFWEYLFDKINKKYNNTRGLQLSKPCHCADSSNKFEMEPKLEPTCCKARKPIHEEKSCSCTGTSASNESSLKYYPHSNTAEGLTLSVPPAGAAYKKSQSVASKKVQCKCYPENEKIKSIAPSKQPSPLLSQAPTSTGRQCQEPHDDITQSLADKYNREILCIHNPPCVLINGCLNFPPSKDAPPVSVWPVTQETKTSYNPFYKNSRKVEQSCQYYVPSVEVRQCQTPEYKTEKIIQSVCDHSPPCEVVRCCNKYRYDPTLKNSCVHVPMCQKVAECMLERKRQNKAVKSCEHKPKCAEVPICTRDYIVLTARDSVGTQVKPQTMMVCRHVPPCIMIPKCLGRAIRESYISYEAIPDCMHQPACEMIPACCRKSTKEMVSICSQYPNGCRVV